MSFKKIFLFITLLGILILPFFGNVSKVQAITAEEIKAQIDALMAQIKALQQQLAGIEEQPAVWCYDFHLNLKYDMGGTEVRALQTALEKEGFYKRTVSGTFDEYTGSAVVGFQEKYKAEILSPWGLEHGTGYVRRTTLAKLNALYGCGVVQPIEPVKPYIKVVSPNGGEEWKMGEKYTISWNAQGVEKVAILLYEEDATSPDGFTAYTWISASSPNTGSHPWIIADVAAGNKYVVRVEDVDNTSLYDYSDETFTIVEEVEEGSCHTSPLWSWDYCTPSCKCEAGEGHCINDASCNTGYCAPNVGPKYGVNLTTMDVCEVKEKSISMLSPYGGEKWIAGQTYTIEWTAPTATRVSIDILDQATGKVATVSPGIIAVIPNTGSYQWTIPSIMPAGNYKAKIYICPTSFSELECANADLSNYGYDESDSYFSIDEPVVASCTDSDGGRDYYTKGTVVVDGVKVLTDSCLTGITLDENFCRPKTSYSIGGAASEGYGCVYGCQNGACKEGITVLSPNGGEEWIEGNTYDIKWHSGGVEKVKIVICCDQITTGGGCVTMFNNINANLGRYSWRIDPEGYCALGDNAKIWLQSTSDIMFEDISDNSFSIGEAISVISPNGGEQWLAGQSYTIKWDAPNITRVSIDILDQATGKVATVSPGIIAVIPNTGSYQWNIPSAMPAGNYKVRVLGCPESFSNTACSNVGMSDYGYDVSDSYFSINK